MRPYVEMMCALKLSNSIMYRKEGAFVDKIVVELNYLMVAKDGSGYEFNARTGEIIAVFGDVEEYEKHNKRRNKC